MNLYTMHFKEPFSHVTIDLSPPSRKSLRTKMHILDHFHWSLDIGRGDDKRRVAGIASSLKCAIFLACLHLTLWRAWPPAWLTGCRCPPLAHRTSRSQPWSTIRSAAGVSPSTRWCSRLQCSAARHYLVI